jgi:putative FmdB family regulatory protein
VPTYQYACTACGHRFEAVQAFTEDSLTTCPECSGQLRKVYGSVGVVFKGSGFYRTDSRASATATAPAGGADKAGADKSGDKGDKGGGDKAGGDKKVAAKADSAGSSKPAASAAGSSAGAGSSGSGSSGGSAGSSKAAAG